MRAIAELGLEYEQAKKFIKERICSQCRCGLWLAWGGFYGINGWVIKCGCSGESGEFIRPYRPSVFESGAAQIYGIQPKWRHKLDKELQKYTNIPVLNKQQATFIIDTMWPKAPLVEKQKAIALCVMEQLNPLMKHVHILGPYKNKKTGQESWALHVGRQANRLMAGRCCDFGYVEERALSKKEVIELTGEDTYDQKLWVKVVVENEKGMKFMGLGFWWKKDEVYGEDKGNSMFNMAAGRAERIALDRCTAGRRRQPLPDLPVIDENFLPDVDKFKPAAEHSDDIAMVNTRTGEIIQEGDYKEVQGAVEGNNQQSGIEKKLPFDGMYGDMKVQCWEKEHNGKKWDRDQFGHLSHSIQGGGFCQLRKLLEPFKAELMEKLALNNDTLNETIKLKYQGKTWSKIDDMDQIDVLEDIYQQVQEKASQASLM